MEGDASPSDEAERFLLVMQLSRESSPLLKAWDCKQEEDYAVFLRN